MSRPAVRGSAVKARPPAKSAAQATPPIDLRHPAAWFTLVAIAAALLTLVTHHLADTDLWQHLRVGRAIWEMRAVPHTHLWTWPRHGEPEVLPSWLFRALLWPFYSAAGVWGLQAWRWWTTLATFGLLALTARRLGTRGLFSWLALVLAALVWRQRSEVRPETLAAVFFAATLWLLERHRAGTPHDQGRAAWGLPFVAMLWVNAHVSWWMGFAMIALFAADAWRRERKPPRTLVLAGAAAVAASFVNPFGWRALAEPFAYQFALRGDPLFQTIAELRPVTWADNLWNGLPLLLVAWPLLAMVRARKHGFDLVETGLMLLFGWLGLTTQRFLGFFALAAAPYLARDLSDALASGGVLRLPAWPRALAVAAAAFAMVATERSHAGLAAGPGVDTRYLPVAACDYMERAGVRGRGWNQFWEGGYLLWRFWPEPDRLPFTDIHQSGSRKDRALMAAIGDGPSAFAALDAEHHFEWVLFANLERLSGDLADVLDQDSTWALVFDDDASLLYLRRDGALARIAARDGYRLLAGGARHLADLGARVSADSTLYGPLRAELQRAIATSPARSGVAQSLLANVAMLEGHGAEAVARIDSARATGVRIPGLDDRRRRAAAMAAGGAR